MDFDVFLAVLTFGFVSSMTPGPNNMMVMASGANFGFRRTIPHMAGVFLGFPAMIFLVGFGLMGLFQSWPLSFTVLKVLSVTYMLYLAWKIAHATAPNEADPSGQPIGFFQAALFQWVNPKAWTMSLTGITVYVGDGNFTGVTILALVFVFYGMLSTASWTLLGQQLRRLLSNNFRLRLFNWTMAVLLIATLYPVLKL